MLHRPFGCLLRGCAYVICLQSPYDVVSVSRWLGHLLQHSFDFNHTNSRGARDPESSQTVRASDGLCLNGSSICSFFRLPWGGSHAAEYCAKLLNLKYPSFNTKITTQHTNVSAAFLQISNHDADMPGSQLTLHLVSVDATNILLLFAVLS